MKVISEMLKRVGFGILALSMITIPEMASAQQSDATHQQQPSPTNDSQAQPATAPATQPAAMTPGVNAAPSQPAPTQSKELPNSPGSVRPQPPAATERPVGTAAAEIGNASGVAASKPAGVAIAPAKQHQSRSLLLKVGAVIGAGVAIGTVMALSNASPSRPPNSQ
jgi:hypothetical protein